MGDWYWIGVFAGLGVALGVAAAGVFGGRRYALAAPFLAAVVASLFFIGSIFTAWALPVFVVPIAITLIGWFWPKNKRGGARQEREVPARLQEARA